MPEDLKARFLQLYEKPNPWNFDDTVRDRSRSEILIDLIKHGSYAKCLDIGCGEGVFTNRIRNCIDSIDAFDISETAIRRANEKFRGTNINFYVQDARDFKASKTYDLILCLEMLYYLDEPARRKLLFEVSKSMNQGAAAILSVVVSGKNRYGDYFTFESIKTLLNEHFRIVHAFSIIPKSGLLSGIMKILASIMPRFDLYKIFSQSTNPTEAYQSGFLVIKK